MHGKIKPAIRLLDNASGGSILYATDHCEDDKMTVRDCLGAKNPPGQPVVPFEVVSTSQKSEFPHPIIFKSLTGSLIKSIAMSIEGAAGPSWPDAIDWRQFCSCYKRASNDLCCSLIAVARKLCSQLFYPAGVTAFVVGRLIALDKNPGVRPIGVGEVSRCVNGKAILRVIGSDIQEAAGSCQLCAGQICWV